MAGAFCAASGTVIASMSDQMPTKIAGMGQVGVALYLLGWSLYDTGVLLRTQSRTKKALVVAFSALVVVSYLTYIVTRSPFALIGLVASWVSFGISLGLGDDNRASDSMWLTVPGAIFVALGILSLALFQRRSCIVDGPGHALCGSGWTLLALI